MREAKQVARELAQARSKFDEISARTDATAEEKRTASELVRTLTDEANAITLAVNAEKAQLNLTSETKSAKEVSRRFSFTKFIRESAGENGADRLTGVEKEVHQMAVEEAKRCGKQLEGAGIPMSVLNNKMTRSTLNGQTAGVLADGGYLINSELQYQNQLRDQLVLTQCGATFVGGLVDNINLIEGSHVTATWEGENDTVADSKMTFTTRLAKPKRLAVNVAISKQLLTQASFDVEQLILRDFYEAHGEALEIAALNGSGEGQPTGLLNLEGIKTIALGENGAIPTWGKIVDMETELGLNKMNTVSAAYLTTGKLKGLFKQTLKAANVPGFIWDNNEINGYRAVSSNLLPSNLTKGSASKTCNSMIFGDFSYLWILGWGGMDIVVDPFTKKKENAYEITMNVLHDVFVRRKEAFVLIKDALVK